MSGPWIPESVALELTLACPNRCATCGSDAGRPRKGELSHSQWLALIDELAGLGTKRLTFIGGEPLTYPGWEALAARGVERGMAVEMVTSAFGLDEVAADKIAQLPLYAVTISVDGTEEVHDAQRGVPGSYRQALRALRLLDARGVPVGIATQINPLTLPVLEQLAPVLEDAGVLGWQVQLTIPTGRARTTDLMLPPSSMPTLYETLQRMKARRGLRPHLTDNLGWFTCDDVELRTPPGMPNRGWQGCLAGIRGAGVTSDGRVKGCLSMPDPDHEGNVKERGFSAIWADPGRFAYTRAFSSDSLRGPCARCAYGRLCRGGCTATAMAVSGRPHVSLHCLKEHTAQRGMS